jgi:hypothetical protein
MSWFHSRRMGWFHSCVQFELEYGMSWFRSCVRLESGMWQVLEIEDVSMRGVRLAE